MSCERYLDLISARLDGELTAAEETGLTAHLQTCPDCRAIAEELQDVHAALVDMGEVQAPAQLSRNVMTQIVGEKQRSRRRFVRQLAGLAACLVLCVGAYRLSQTESPAADPNLPSVARYADPLPSVQTLTEAHPASAQQHLRLSGMSTSLEPTACLLDGADALIQLLARFPDDDLSAVTDTYNEEFFRTHCLLAVAVQEPSSSITHTITSVEGDKVSVVRRVPQAGDCDMALWLLLAEVDAAAGPARALAVEWVNE